MPSPLIKRIQIMRTFAVIQLVCIVLLICASGFLIQAVFDPAISSGGILVFGIVMLICCLTLLGIRCYFRKSGDSFPPYRILILPREPETAAAMLCAREIEDGAYGFVGASDGIKVRILALYQPQFTEDQLASRRKKVNAIFNKNYGTPREESFFDAVSRLRINLVICQEETEQLNNWVSRRTSQMLSRNESIVSAAIVLSRQELLFPALLSGDIALKEIKKYEVAASILTQRLGQ